MGRRKHGDTIKKGARRSSFVEWSNVTKDNLPFLSTTYAKLHGFGKISLIALLDSCVDPHSM